MELQLKRMAKTDTTVPMYRQIMEYILSKINSGEWQVHERIPPEAKLVQLFDASRMTVNRALRELTSEGRLVRKQGNGTFVAPVKSQSALLEIKSIAEEIRSRGGEYSCDVHLLCEEKASPELALDLRLKPYSNVYHSIIVHKDNCTPILLADRFINPVVVPEFLEQDFTRTSVTEYLLTVAPVERVKHVVEALIPASWIRTLLDISAAEPCLSLNRTTWSKSQVATRSCLYYPGSRYSLGGTFTTSNKGVIRVA